MLTAEEFDKELEVLRRKIEDLQDLEDVRDARVRARIEGTVSWEKLKEDLGL